MDALDASVKADAGQLRDQDGSADVLNRLLQAAGRVSAWQTAQLRGLGLSPSAFAVLSELAGADADGLQPCTLADLLSVTRPSVCGLIDGLEAKGLVERTPHRRDGRRVLVRLTAPGSDVLAEHRTRYAAGQRELVAALSFDERVRLGALLDRVGA